MRIMALGGIFLALGCNGCNSTPEPTPPATTVPEATGSTSGSDGAAPTTGATTGDCVTGGCSGELCLEPGSEPTQPTFTNCEYKREYECYKTATCSRDAEGKCNWEMTPELDKCLNKRK